MTSESMWQLFLSTGNVLFYCLYKELTLKVEEESA